MKTAFHPRLINDPFGDPGLYIQFLYKKRAILFDLGKLDALSIRDLLKITHIFVSHTHIDHFIGFDTLLRHLIGRDKVIFLYGPEGFMECFENRIRSYNWNLIKEYENELIFNAGEIREDEILMKPFHSSKGFKGGKMEVKERDSLCLIEEDSFSIETEIFDHKIPVLGFSLIENFHINIDKSALDEMDIPVGPWINQFKEALYKNPEGDERFIVRFKKDGRQKELEFNLRELSDRISKITKGQKITYITDIVGSKENMEKAIDLARGADHLFIEATFMDRDRDMAHSKYHLTAKEAGIIARKARVKNLTLFHFSPRYSTDSEEIIREAHLFWHSQLKN